VARIEAGDERGPEDLWRRFAPGVRRYVERRIGSQAAEDAVQDIFLSVMVAIRGGQLRDARRLAGYVARVAQRRVYDETRRRQREHARCSEVDIERVGRPALQEGYAILSERRSRLAQWLDEMGVRDREVLVAAIREESTDETARRIGVGRHQVRVIKMRAVRKLLGLTSACAA